MGTSKHALLLGVSVTALSVFALPAQAVDSYSPPPEAVVPVETWTGFSIGGGGVGIFNTNVEGTAEREDELCEITATDPFACVQLGKLALTQQFEINDLGDEGGLGTIQLAYDKQVHQRWVLGAFVDADFYEASATHDSSASGSFLSPVGDDDDDDEAWAFISSKAEMELDWSGTVGGRIGKLVTPSTLLYFLAGYTHMELDKAQFSVFTNAAFEPIGEAGPFAGECGEDVFGPCPLSFTIALPDSADGYTLGGGAQMKLHGPWSLKFEYRFTHINYNGSGVGEDFEFFVRRRGV